MSLLHGGVAPSRQMSILKRSSGISGPDAVIVESLPTRHVHLPQGGHGHSPARLPVDMIDWMAHVDEEMPQMLVATAAKYVLEPQTPLPTGSILTNPTASVFVRILNSKVYSHERNYQLAIRVGHHICTSCASDKNGDIVDWFLFDVASLNAEESSIEIGVLSNGHESRQRTLKSKAQELFNFGRQRSRSSADALQLAEGDLANVSSSVKFSLASVVLDEKGTANGIMGTYYLVDQHTKEPAGEVTFHIIASPESFTLSRSLSRMALDAKFQAPLSFLRPSRIPNWQRVWASLVGRELLIHDFQRKERALEWSIPLGRVIKVDCTNNGLHACGVQNVIELTFEDGQVVLAYADSAEAALLWVNHISQSLWGQPYN